MCVWGGRGGRLACPREAPRGSSDPPARSLGTEVLFLSLFVHFTFASVYLGAGFIYVAGRESGRRWGRQGEELVEGPREAELRGCDK